MGSRIFLAGATGVIGTRLIPMLCAAGHTVAGSTRSAAKVPRVQAMGAQAVVVDVFDAKALTRALMDFAPQIMIHQLTDLPQALMARDMDAAIARNARIRTQGTTHLVRAALAAGARRLVAQSIAWAYAPGAEPHRETDPLDLTADGSRGVTIAGVAALERQVLAERSLHGVVLRYGRLYGPGTGSETAPAALPLHVDAAAHAAVLAVESTATGVFNIVEANDEVATEAAQTVLGWRAGFRCVEAVHGR